MTTIEAITAGTTYNLTDGTPGYLMAASGLGIAGVTRYSRRGPQQHGTTDTGYRFEPRLIRLLIGFDADYSTHYTQRAVFIEIFKPSDDPILLRWTLPDASVRQIDAFYNGGLDFDTERLFGFSQEEPVELKCGDPFFYDPTVVVITFTSDDWTGGFTVPMPVPFAVGASDFDTTQALTYTGSAPSYPALRITGPITNPVIRNMATGEQIALTGSVPAGDYWDIELSPDYKTIVNSAGYSQMEYLSDDSTLSTFRLEPSPVVASGSNPIKMTGTGTNGVTSLRVSYFRRYVGL